MQHCLMTEEEVVAGEYEAEDLMLSKKLGRKMDTRWVRLRMAKVEGQTMAAGSHTLDNIASYRKRRSKRADYRPASTV